MYKVALVFRQLSQFGGIYCPGQNSKKFNREVTGYEKPWCSDDIRMEWKFQL